jgi:hypothetical protein
VVGTFVYNGGYVELTQGRRKKFISRFLLNSIDYSASVKSEFPRNGIDAKLNAKLLFENEMGIHLFSDLPVKILPCATRSKSR